MAIVLFKWPALSLAVQNQWGGPESESKREWFAGVITDMFVDRPETDLEDVETTLLQVMLDEFEVSVEDESAYEVAQQIMRLRASTVRGDFSEVDELHASWLAKKGSDRVRFQQVQNEDEEADEDSESVDLAEDDEEDVEMADVSQPPQEPTKRSSPEVDADGFTKVVGRRKR